MNAQRSKLALDLLLNHFSVLNENQQKRIIGGNGYGSDGGYWSHNEYGQYTYTYNGGTLNEVNITTGSSQSGYGAYDTVSIMLTSLGISADHADAARIIMNLESKGLAMASRSFGIAGMMLNAYDFYNDPNLVDGLQIALGLGLLITGSAGFIAVGGTILFASEIMQLYYNGY